MPDPRMIEAARIGNGYANGGIDLDANGVLRAAGAATFGGLVNFASGTNWGDYIPTITNGFNVASHTFRAARFVRAGNIIVSVAVDITPSAGLTNTQFEISLPVPSAFTTIYQCGGVAAAYISGNPIIGGLVNSHIANDTAFVYTRSISTTVHPFWVNFTYKEI